jgi:hypothetical protein
MGVTPLRSEDPIWFSALGPARCAQSVPTRACDRDFSVEAMGLEPTNLLTASQALYQLSYAPRRLMDRTSWA